jgi:hypothetical protein
MKRSCRISSFAIAQLILFCGLSLLLSLPDQGHAKDSGILAPIARKTFEKKVMPLFGDRLTIKDIEVSLFKQTVVLTNISLRHPPGFGDGVMFSVESLTMQVPFSSLLKQNFIIRNAVIVNPEVTIIQKPDGRINIPVEIMRLSRLKAKEGEKEIPAVSFFLDSVSIENGLVQIFSPVASNRKGPAFEIEEMNATLRNVTLPNIRKDPSGFDLEGILSSRHPAKIFAHGDVTIGIAPITFTADTSLENIWIEDFSYLMPNSAVSLSSGIVNIESNFTCHGIYLENRNHIKIENLLLKEQGGLARKLFLGLPASAVVNLLKEENGTITLDFTVSGPFETLRTELKKAIAASLEKSFKQNFSNRVSGFFKRIGEKITKPFR